MQGTQYNLFIRPNFLFFFRPCGRIVNISGNLNVNIVTTFYRAMVRVLCTPILLPWTGLSTVVLIQRNMRQSYQNSDFSILGMTRSVIESPIYRIPCPRETLLLLGHRNGLRSRIPPPLFFPLKKGVQALDTQFIDPCIIKIVSPF